MLINSKGIMVISLFLTGGCTHDVTRELHHPPAPSPTKAEIVGQIGRLPAWPTDFGKPILGDEFWLQMLRTAQVLQRVDDATLLSAFVEFVGQNSSESEWSKVFLLLRVMYDVPSSRDTAQTSPNALRPYQGGFGTGYEGDVSVKEMDRLRGIPSFPIRWRDGRPELVGPLVSYNGPPYDARRDWTNLSQSYGYRDLDPLIRRLETARKQIAR